MWSIITDFSLNAVCCYFQKMQGADGEKFLVGSRECSYYSHLSLSALLLSVWIHSLAGELKPLVRMAEWRVWRVNWKLELLTHFWCLHQLWGWWSSSAWWCYWMQTSAAHCCWVFSSRKHFWVLAGHNSLSFCPVRMKSICQSSAPVTVPAPCWWCWPRVLWVRRAEKASLFIAGIALQFSALWHCSYQVPSLLERKTTEAKLLSFLPSQYFGNQIFCQVCLHLSQVPHNPCKAGCAHWLCSFHDALSAVALSLLYSEALLEKSTDC